MTKQNKRGGVHGTGVGLESLLADLEIVRRCGKANPLISGVVADSREVQPGSLFVAVPGLRVDGHAYLESAFTKGCAAVLVAEGRCRDWRHPGIPCLEVRDPRLALGKLAAAFSGKPAQKMTLVAITGTNGKTTTSYLLEAILRKAGANPGVIGTVNFRYNGRELPASHTTPDPVVLHRVLAEMAEGGVSHLVIETSSHALEQDRLSGLSFDVALFINLSRDHLDFHPSMEAYFASKKKLFVEHLKPGGSAVVLCEEGQAGDWGRRLIAELEAEQGGAFAGRMIVCGGPDGEIRIKSVSNSLEGTRLTLEIPSGNLELSSSLVGHFNLQNLLGAVSVAQALGVPDQVLVEGLASAAPPPGRLEKIAGPPGVGVFVDFAHTPDALENVLRAMRPLCSGRLLVVFGCGGDRDRGKRPLMGRAAGMLADLVVLTSDNPRSEEPGEILRQIEWGLIEIGLPRRRLESLLGDEGTRGYDILPSRREAIRTSIRLARPGDLVVICGKGHETYQITRRGKRFFDDRLEAAAQTGVISW